MKQSRFYLILFAVILLFCGVGCDDDDSSSSTEPGKTMAFTAETQNPPDNSVSLRFVRYSGDDMILEVYAKNIADVYGAAFALQYEPTVFQYIAATEGTYFNGSGAPTSFMAAAGTGTLTIGCSILGAETQPINGSGPICSIVFRALENGQSRFTFREQRMYDSTGSVIDGVQWFGGVGIVND